MADDELKGPGEISKALAARGVPVSAKTLRAWARAGRVPSVRTPTGRTLLRVRDVLRVLETRGAPSGGEPEGGAA
jgi:predicted site-specific integrase-resolvase